MKIVGFNFSKIMVEKNAPPAGGLEVKSNLSIDNIFEDKTILLEGSPTLRFDFTFTISYEPGVGKVEIKGSIMGVEEKEGTEEILKEWKKKKFSPRYKIQVFNFILNKCNLRAIQIEDEVGLPLHVPFPQLTPKESDKDSAESKKENSAKYTG